MELVVMSLLALGITALIRRRDFFKFRWQPDRFTWLALGTGVLAFLFSAALLWLEPNAVPHRLVHHLLIYGICGVGLPFGVNFLLEHQGWSGLAITRHRWLPALLVNLGLGAFFALLFFTQVDLTRLDAPTFARASLALTGAGGLFELFLYYAFIHTRLEKAFGPLPAILATTLLYVSWHIGTQLPLEPQPLAAALKLFWVGIMYQSVFSLLRNLLAIYPFFHWSGVILDFTVNFDGLAAAAASFNWALVALAWMALLAIAVLLLARRRTRAPLSLNAERISP